MLLLFKKYIHKHILQLSAAIGISVLLSVVLFLTQVLLFTGLSEHKSYIAFSYLIFFTFAAVLYFTRIKSFNESINKFITIAIIIATFFLEISVSMRVSYYKYRNFEGDYISKAAVLKREESLQKLNGLIKKHNKLILQFENSAADSCSSLMEKMNERGKNQILSDLGVIRSLAAAQTWTELQSLDDKHINNDDYLTINGLQSKSSCIQTFVSSITKNVNDIRKDYRETIKKIELENENTQFHKKSLMQSGFSEQVLWFLKNNSTAIFISMLVVSFMELYLIKNFIIKYLNQRERDNINNDSYLLKHRRTLLDYRIADAPIKLGRGLCFWKKSLRGSPYCWLYLPKETAVNIRSEVEEDDHPLNKSLKRMSLEKERDLLLFKKLEIIEGYELIAFKNKTLYKYLGRSVNFLD